RPPDWRREAGACHGKVERAVPPAYHGVIRGLPTVAGRLPSPVLPGRPAMKLLLLCFALLVFLATGSLQAADLPNQLTAEEEREDFALLFNGQTLEGWKHSGNWKVEEGAIARTGKGGDL